MDDNNNNDPMKAAAGYMAANLGGLLSQITAAAFFFGGMIYLVFSVSIGYMAEMDWNAMVGVLFSLMVIAGMYIVGILSLLFLPALFWFMGDQIDNSSQGEGQSVKPSLGFVVVLIVSVGVCAVLASTHGEFSAYAMLFGSLVALILFGRSHALLLNNEGILSTMQCMAGCFIGYLFRFLSLIMLHAGALLFAYLVLNDVVTDDSKYEVLAAVAAVLLVVLLVNYLLVFNKGKAFSIVGGAVLLIMFFLWKPMVDFSVTKVGLGAVPDVTFTVTGEDEKSAVRNFMDVCDKKVEGDCSFKAYLVSRIGSHYVISKEKPLGNNRKDYLLLPKNEHVYMSF